MYKYNPNGPDRGVIRLSDGANIPASEENRDYREYLVWVADGGVTQSADNNQPSAEELLEQAWSNFRSLRNSMLTSTDYTQLVDAPFSSEEKQEYRNYRQYLRDLPQGIYDAEMLDAAVILTFEEYNELNNV